MMNISVYASAISPRLQYVLDFIFRTGFDTGYTLTTDKDAFLNADGMKINYSTDYHARHINIKCSGLLDRVGDTSRHGHPFHDLEFPGLQLLFKENKLKADILVWIFLLLSRAEEYGANVRRDDHGRFVADQSILARHDLLEYPVVDQWIRQLREFIARFYNRNLRCPSTFRSISTIDVDHISAFRHKSVFRNALGMARDILRLRIVKVVDRMGFRQDPYDTFRDLLDINEKLGHVPVFFLLTLLRQGPYDRNIPAEHPAFSKLVNALTPRADIGLHPSYRAFNSESATSAEKKMLERISPKEITKSRQHYIRLSLPRTYRILNRLGIEEDYSMGYPDRLGFRAGTAHPFHWYDLEMDKVTSLLLVPFQVMDVTMKKHMALRPDEAIAVGKDIIDRVRDVSATFCLLWHNSSFYDQEGWMGWLAVYEELLYYAKS